MSNAPIFDLEVTAEDMLAIDRLDTHEHVGADPDNFDF
jgi:methylglyoxal/glyoxal reductase